MKPFSVIGLRGQKQIRTCWQRRQWTLEEENGGGVHTGSPQLPCVCNLTWNLFLKFLFIFTRFVHPHVNVCISVCVYIHICVHTYIWIGKLCVCQLTFLCVCLFICVRVHTHTYVFIYLCLCHMTTYEFVCVCPWALRLWLCWSKFNRNVSFLLSICRFQESNSGWQSLQHFLYTTRYFIISHMNSQFCLW